MDGKGRATDHAFIERWWHSVQQECTPIEPSDDGLECDHKLEKYVRFDHDERLIRGFHSKRPSIVTKKSINRKNHESSKKSKKPVVRFKSEWSFF
ncbi:MAG: hypothetical protein OXC67_08155 [Flavobacteriaceae bacterium]|nr:hypothetical protein [Flavobacteriaceae bacterium]MCY4298601.1 hypothetical protein [Flavobacteriaceae bacterium]